MILKAPAKINLYLEIINKRPDGYHNIESVMHTVGLFDILEFDLNNNPKIELSCSDKSLPVDSTNIVYKTAKKMQKKYNIKQGIKIHLTKNIPTGAGLGGGSSDSATTIKALNKIWNINASKEELESFAKTLGADIPFFFTGGTAKVEGIGEIVTKIPSKNNFFVVLVKPNFGVSTAYAYSKVKMPLTNQHEIHRITNALREKAFTTQVAKELLFNRFEEFVFPENLEIEKIKKTLESFGCASLMSGSGATVFALTSGQEQSDEVVKQLGIYKWNTWAVSSCELHENAGV
ncbi:MAG: 4-(cytidine 5'-diphospho)-2-C-methyl-D-erythritol kinase [Endomicrobiaceae bacterium]|nr:4-(cytidine 5'-diphospho)-2-C-methyl-D-erythritol kinase [Endomicrobiaceae bacterium]